MVLLIRYLAIAFLVYWVYRRLNRFFTNQVKHQQGKAQQGPRPVRHPQPAYAVLGIGPEATADEIKAAYRHKISEYHPDKVAHLGDELKRLAKIKSAEINNAYKELTADRPDL